jgi:hypothetical protein
MLWGETGMRSVKVLLIASGMTAWFALAGCGLSPQPEPPSAKELDGYDHGGATGGDSDDRGDGVPGASPPAMEPNGSVADPSEGPDAGLPIDREASGQDGGVVDGGALEDGAADGLVSEPEPMDAEAVLGAP